jgi:hypothetical protein
MLGLGFEGYTGVWLIHLSLNIPLLHKLAIL